MSGYVSPGWGSEQKAAGENGRSESQAGCQAAQVVVGGGLSEHCHLRATGHSADRPGMKMSATSPSPTAAPTSCMAMNPARAPGAMPAKVSVKARPMVTA